MTFDENGICVLESLTSVDECEAYIDFLKYDERPRHQAAKMIAENFIAWAFHRSRIAPDAEAYLEAKARLYDSAATRHQQDIDAIAKRLLEIEAHKAKLEGK